MTENHEAKRRYRKGVGADLILPMMAAGYAAYYLYTVTDYPWEAQMNGSYIAVAIWLLVAILLVRTFLRLRRGEVTLRPTAVARPRGALAKRSLFIVLTAANILLMPWLGFTLTVILFLVASMWVLGVRDIKPLAAISLATGAVGYLFFIVTLDTRLPKGPVEWLLQRLF